MARAVGSSTLPPSGRRRRPASRSLEDRLNRTPA